MSDEVVVPVEKGIVHVSIQRYRSFEIMVERLLEKSQQPSLKRQLS